MSSKGAKQGKFQIVTAKAVIMELHVGHFPGQQKRLNGRCANGKTEHIT